MIQNRILNVSGMKCGGCEANVIGKLSPIKGVISVTAEFKADKVTLEFDDKLTDLDSLTKVITITGFTVI